MDAMNPFLRQQATQQAARDAELNPPPLNPPWPYRLLPPDLFFYKLQRDPPGAEPEEE